MTARSKLLMGATTIAAATLLLAACGGDSSGGGSSSTSATAASSSSSTSAASSSAAASPSDSTEASPSGSTEEIFASLCDEATAEQVALIKGLMKPDFKVSQLVDVRTDDDGRHAVLGFVEGPGLAVLAVWTGDGLALDGLAAADEFAAQASTAEASAPDADTQKLIDATPECYTTIFAPQ